MTYVPVGLGQAVSRYPMIPPGRRRPIAVRLPRLAAVRGRGLGQAGCEWISQQNGSPFWGQYVDANGNPCSSSGQPCTSSYTGCGSPPAAPALSTSNTAGQNIIAENEEFAANPNLNSAAYLAAEAADSGVTPGTNAQNTQAELVTYCQQNLENNQIFGDPLDTLTCLDGQPLASLTAAAAKVSPGPTIVTLPGPGLAPSSKTTAPVSTPAAASIANTSRPGQPLAVGDSFAVTITGAPNSPVVNSATQNGQSLGSTSYGNTNGSGSATVTGTISSSSMVGSWVETWSVGGVAAAPISFTVSAAPAAPGGSSGGSTSQTPGPGAPAGAFNFTFPTFGGGSCFQPMQTYFSVPDPCFGPIGITTLGVGIGSFILLAMMFGGKKGRR